MMEPPSSRLPTEWTQQYQSHYHALVTLRGGSSPSPSIVEEILKCDPDDYYAILGLEASSSATSSSTSPTQITKAYRKRAVQTHPDKTKGDRSAFDLVAKAYEILGDESKKAIYDKYGVAGLNASGSTPGGASSFQDFFSTMFQQQQQQQRRPSKNQTRRYQLQVSLEDLYQGVTQQVFIQEPGTFRRNQQHGKQVEVRIPKGTVSGQPLRLDGAMDFDTTQQPADLIFIVVEAPHPTFTRKNHDLAMEFTISLQDALCGFDNKKIPFLDGSRLHIASATSKHPHSSTPMVISTGDVQVLKGKGFPKSPQADPKDADAHGDLYIQFRVAPIQPSPTAKWSPEDRQQLRDLLDKLQGKKKPVTSKASRSSTQSTHKTKASKKSKKSGKDKMTKHSKVADDDGGDDLYPSIDSSKETSVTIHSLVPGKATNFGRATGTAKIQRDEHDDDENEFFEGRGGFPFGNGASTFFQSSNDGRARSFSFGSSSSPFGGTGGLDDDEAQSQCQQM